MGYLGYPDYSHTDTGVPYPKDWTTERLRFLIISNPVKSEVNDWDEDELVSFVPMDSVGEYGGIDCSQERPIGEVYGGYTYFINGDILVAKITPCFENGKGAIADGLTNGVGFGTTEFHVMRPLEDLSERWLFYLSLSDAFRKIGASEMLGAGGQKRVPESFIKNFRVGLPSPPEQQHIADFLDWKTGQIDALIAKKRQLIEKLQEQRIAIITRAVTKGLNPDVPMKDSGILWLGQVPEGWEVKRLRFAVAKIEQGWSPQCDNQPADDNYWGVMKVGCVNGDTFDPLENKALPPDLEPKENYELKPRDIIISRANTKELLGSAAIVPADVRPKLLLCDKLYRVMTPTEVDENFLTYYLRTPISRYQYEREATGASNSMQNIGQDTIKNLVVVLPPLEEQEVISKAISTAVLRLDKLMSASEAVITRLTEYRTALITAATTGKIDVRNVTIPTSSAEQLNLAFADEEERRA